MYEYMVTVVLSLILSFERLIITENVIDFIFNSVISISCFVFNIEYQINNPRYKTPIALKLCD